MMFHLRSNVIVLVLLAAALQQAYSSSSSSVVIAEYSRGDGEVLLAEEEDESSSSSVDTLDELQLVALKESYRDESLPMVSFSMWHTVGVTSSSSCCNKPLILFPILRAHIIYIS
jgi:hypothetical protein